MLGEDDSCKLASDFHKLTEAEAYTHKDMCRHTGTLLIRACKYSKFVVLFSCFQLQ